MSGYTVGEIVVWLLLAAGLGFALGWVARELLLRSQRELSDVRPTIPAARLLEEAAVEESPVEHPPVKKAATKKAPAKKAAPRVPRAAPSEPPDNT